MCLPMFKAATWILLQKKKKTWQNKGSIFEPSQTQHWQPNLNFSQSDQLAKETIMHTVNCTKVPRRERKGCQKKSQ